MTHNNFCPGECCFSHLLSEEDFNPLRKARHLNWSSDQQNISARLSSGRSCHSCQCLSGAYAVHFDGSRMRSTQEIFHHFYRRGITDSSLIIERIRWRVSEIYG